MRATKNKKTGRYQYRFYADNKQQCFSSLRDFPKGQSQKQADEVALSIHKEFMLQLKHKQSSSLLDCFDLYIKIQEDKGIKRLEVLKAHIKMCLTHIKDDDKIYNIHIVANNMLDHMRKNKKSNGRPYSDATLKKRAGIFASIGALAYKNWGLLDTPLYEKINSVKTKKRTGRALTKNEAEQLIKTINCDQTRHLVIFRLLTGIRHAELEKLKEQKKDAEIGDKLTIDASASKTGVLRSFPISPEARDAYNSLNYPLENYHYYWKRFKEAVDKLGLKGVVMHTLRHSFASWLAQSGDVTMWQLKEVMGHSNISMTDRYTHLMPDHLKNVASSLSLNF